MEPQETPQVRLEMGGVLGNSVSEWICGFHASFDMCSPVKYELMAMLHGLRIASYSPCSKITVHMDSLVVSKMLKEPLKGLMLFFVIKNAKN